jgi:hypothetical protein
LIADVFNDAGIRPVGNARLLPGYYRASKNWDVVVTHKGAVVAIIELKSQVGSFGNNLNNRIEEMIGQSLDLWRSVRENLLGEIRPWFGYLMLLESREQSRDMVRMPKTAFPLDPEFASTSYIDRYQIALKRLRHEGDMNAVCLVTADREQDEVGYPDKTMTFTSRSPRPFTAGWRRSSHSSGRSDAVDNTTTAVSWRDPQRHAGGRPGAG